MEHVTLTSYRTPGDGNAAEVRVPLAIRATEVGVVRVVTGAGAVAARWEDTGSVPADWVAGVVAVLEGDWRAGHDVPIDWEALPSTELERRIWNHLRGVGPGQKVEAAEVAEAVTTDVDEAVGPLPRAEDVVRACTRDPIPALIACTRVAPAGAEGPLPRPAPRRPAPATPRPRPPARERPAPSVWNRERPRVAWWRRSGAWIAAAGRLVLFVPVFVWFFVIKRERLGW